MRRERPGCPFSMNKQGLLDSIDHVLLYLSDIMRDVVYELHVEVIRGAIEHLPERLHIHTEQGYVVYRDTATA